jgi:hypothetical protein
MTYLRCGCSAFLPDKCGDLRGPNFSKWLEDQRKIASVEKGPEAAGAEILRTVLNRAVQVIDFTASEPQHCLVCGSSPVVAVCAMDTGDGGLVPYVLCNEHWDGYQKDDRFVIEQIELALKRRENEEIGEPDGDQVAIDAARLQRKRDKTVLREASTK